jgi:hypothetical protein
VGQLRHELGVLLCRVVFTCGRLKAQIDSTCKAPMVGNLGMRVIDIHWVEECTMGKMKRYRRCIKWRSGSPTEDEVLEAAFQSAVILGTNAT